MSSQFVLLTFFWRLLHFLNDTQYNILLFIYLYIIVTKKIKNLYIVNVILFCFYLKIDYVPYTTFYSSIWNLNTTLTNGLCLIHPLLVYLLYIYILVYIFRKYDIYYYWFVWNFKFYLLSINVLALILGSWWAYQELNWGGWWNWDFVELILFIFFIKNIILTHSFNFFKTFYFYSFNVSYFFYLILFFVFVRWDILNSVHSFNLLSSFENYINYIFFIFLLFLIYYLLVLTTTYKKLNSKYIFNKNIFILTNVNLFLNLFIYITIIFFIYNVIITLNNQTEQSETVNFLKLFLVLFFCLSFLFFQKKISIWSFLICIVIKSLINVLFFLSSIFLFFRKKYFYSTLLHVILLFSFLIFFYSDDFELLFWEKKTNSTLNKLVILKNNLLLSYNSLFLYVNLINDKGDFLNTLLESISFFKIKSSFLSFSLCTEVDSFIVYNYSHFLLILWVSIFLCFLVNILSWKEKQKFSNIY